MGSSLSVLQPPLGFRGPGRGSGNRVRLLSTCSGGSSRELCRGGQMRGGESQVAVPEATLPHRWAGEGRGPGTGMGRLPHGRWGYKLTCGPAGLAHPRHLLSCPRGPLTQLAGLGNTRAGGGGGGAEAARNPRAKPVSRDGRRGARPHSSTTGSPLGSPPDLAPPNPGPRWLGGERTCPGRQPRALGSRGKPRQFFEGGR